MAQQWAERGENKLNMKPNSNMALLGSFPILHIQASQGSWLLHLYLGQSSIVVSNA